MTRTPPIWTTCHRCNDLKPPGVRHVCASDAWIPWCERNATALLLGVFVAVVIAARFLGV